MKRPIIFDGDIAYITLTRGYIAVIDAADADLVSGRNWCATPQLHTVYAQRRVRLGAGKHRMLLLHRIILGLTDPGIFVDHIDGDGLNNRRSNLRPCSPSQNLQNTGIPRNNTSGFKGVSWDVQAKKWQANIRLSGVQTNLGRFSTKEEAHAAYCAAAFKHHGEFYHIGRGRRRNGGQSSAPAAALPGVQ